MSNWLDLFQYTYININQYFDKIYYINLNKRNDRLVSIQKQLSLYNIRATRIAGIEPSINNHKINNGQLGCLLSHLSIINDSIYNQYRRILILEDDTIFKDNFLVLFSRLVASLPDQWDMLYLCGNHFGGREYFNEHVYRSYGTLSTNAYAINQSIMYKIYNLLIQQPYEKPIDSIYCSLHPAIRTYSSAQNICYQMAGFSDIENKITDYHVLK